MVQPNPGNVVQPKPDIAVQPKPEPVESPKPDIVVPPNSEIVEPPKPEPVEPKPEPEPKPVEPPTPEPVEPPKPEPEPEPEPPTPEPEPVVKKPEPLSEERLSELIKLSNMYGETKDGHFVGPTVVMSEGKPIGTAVFDDEGRTFRYSLTDKSVLYEGRAVFSWETKKCTVDQHPNGSVDLSEPPRL